MLTKISRPFLFINIRKVVRKGVIFFELLSSSTFFWNIQFYHFSRQKIFIYFQGDDKITKKDENCGNNSALFPMKLNLDTTDWSPGCEAALSLYPSCSQFLWVSGRQCPGFPSLDLFLFSV